MKQELEDFSKNINKMTSNKLCEIIVSFRYIGVMKEEAVLCMMELAARRNSGDSFKYEDHIDMLMKGLPKINTDLNNLFRVKL